MRSIRGRLLRLILGGYPLPRDLVRSAFRRYRSRPALIGPGGARSYGQLEERVYRLAQALEMLGLGRGDPLFTLLPNDLEAVETRLAAAEIGAMLVPLPPALPAEALRRATALVRPEVVVHDPGLGCGAVEALRSACPHLRLLPGALEESTSGCCRTSRPVHPGPRCRPATRRCWVTPGPGGEPRGLTFSQEALVAALRLAVLNLDRLPAGPEVLLRPSRCAGAAVGRCCRCCSPAAR